MKTKLFFLLAVMLIPLMLSAQKGKWLRKGLHASDTQEKIEYFTKSIEVEDKDAKAYFYRGYVYLFNEQYEDAISDFNASIEIESYPASYFYRGYAYDDLEQYELAIADYSKVIEISPKFSDAYYNRSIAYYSLDKYELALIDCNKVIELDPKDGDSYFIRGTILLELGEYERAVKDLSKAIKIDPNNSDAYYNRDVAYEYLWLIEGDIEEY
jgi:tetratricopeptide (TPR) repeat protein